MSDPIADMLCQIANANHKLKDTVELPSSKVKAEIARVLKEEGFISHFKVQPDKKQGVLKLSMKYSANRDRVIQGLTRVSKSSRRQYAGWEEIPSIQNGLGIAVVSTSKGIMSSLQAKAKKLGGEILAYVW